MREKRSARAAIGGRRRSEQSQGTAGWVVQNELGRGVPNVLLVVLAGLLIAGRVIRWEVGRAWSWVGRRRER